MDIQQLRYFVAVAQELHFNRAAQKTHVTQPTLSQQLKKLEDELGKPLLERSPQKTRLTQAGEKFLPYALSVLEQLQKGVRELRENSEVTAGTVRLGVIPTIGPYLMPDVIIRLGKSAPQVRIELYEETTSVLLEKLRSGNLDIGILALPVEEKGIAARGLSRESFYLAVAAKHRLASKRMVTRQEVLREKLLILKEGHCFGQQSIQFCKLARTDSRVVFQGSSLTSVLALAEAGEGVTFVPEMALLRLSGFRLKFIAFAPQDRPCRELGAAWRLNAPLERAQKEIIRITEECLNGKAADSGRKKASFSKIKN
jgi:LysR family transcriptional regulator, hydrogen peroxide-inducible genes activator